MLKLQTFVIIERKI